MTNIYWQERRSGQRLVLDTENGDEVVLGAVRQTKHGYDAYATTMGYDPGRATKGLPTLAEAKAFVESFQPWDMYEGTGDLVVDTEVRLLEE